MRGLLLTCTIVLLGLILPDIGNSQGKKDAKTGEWGGMGCTTEL